MENTCTNEEDAVADESSSSISNEKSICELKEPTPFHNALTCNQQQTLLEHGITTNETVDVDKHYGTSQHATGVMTELMESASDFLTEKEVDELEGLSPNLKDVALYQQKPISVKDPSGTEAAEDNTKSQNMFSNHGTSTEMSESASGIATAEANDENNHLSGNAEVWTCTPIQSPTEPERADVKKKSESNPSKSGNATESISESTSGLPAESVVYERERPEIWTCNPVQRPDAAEQANVNRKSESMLSTPLKENKVSECTSGLGTENAIYQKEHFPRNPEVWNCNPVLRPPSPKTETDEFVELDEEVRIVLLGKTGNGKSATGNTILGREGKFAASSSAQSVTVKCTRGCSTRFKKDIHVIDTPGLFDTNISNEKVQEEIVRCIHITAPGPHAFILVLGLTRFTQEEYNAVTHFVNQFGERIYEYFIILFTRKDDLEHENKTLDDHLKTLPGNLLEIVKKCGYRCIAFNNRATGWSQEKQVKSLLKMIQENILRNKEKYYSDDMFKKATEIMRQNEAEIKRQMEEEKSREIKKIRQEIEKDLKEKMEQQEEILAESEKYLKDVLEKLSKKEIEVEACKNSISELKQKISEQSADTKYLREELGSKLEKISNSSIEISTLRSELQEITSKRDENLEKIKKLEIDSKLKTKQIDELLTAKKRNEMEKKARENAKEEIEKKRGKIKQFFQWLGGTKREKLEEDEYVEKAMKEAKAKQ